MTSIALTVPLGRWATTSGASWCTWPSRVSSPLACDDHYQHLDLVVAVRLDAVALVEPDQVGLQVLSVEPPPALRRHRPRRGWPGRPEGWAQACRHLPIPDHHLPNARNGGRGLSAGFSAAIRKAFRRGAWAKHDLAGTDEPGGIAAVGVMKRPRRRCQRRVRAPAPGRGSAVVAATRPVPRRQRVASRARGVPAGPPVAALDPGPGGAGRRPRRPPGRLEPGRPAARTRHR